MYDVIIKHAHIADGTGNPMYHADVAVKDGKIACIGHNLQNGTIMIDGTGKVLAPGFIDAHSHHDMKIEEAPECEHLLIQGVTTSVGGMCGESPVPVSQEHLNDCMRIVGQNNTEESIHARLKLHTYLKHINRPLGGNLSFLIGHGNLRAAVMGYAAKKANDEDLRCMEKLLRECMDAGAMGMSFGLIYPPGSYADTDELIAMAKVVAEYGGVITAHIRGEGDTLIQAVDELLRVTRATGVRTVLSHHKATGGLLNWNKTAATISMIKKAVAEGFDVFCDQYPYTASSNVMKNLIPQNLHALGHDKMMELVTNPELRKDLYPAVCKGQTSWEALHFVMIGSSPSHAEFAGRMLNDIATEKGVEPFDVFCDLLRDDNMTTRAIYHTACEEDVERVLRWERTMIGSDGGYLPGVGGGHPRTYSTFARVLGRYVREKKIISLEDAIRKMTYMPAMVYGLSTKGLIREGMDADLVLFDPARVNDLSTFAQPDLGNQGFSCVLVDGKIVLQNDQCTGVMAGKLIFR